MITAEQFAILAAPFPAKDHEFKPPNGFIYISEEAICQRIEQVDLSWEWRIETVNRYDPKASIATTIGHMTICGVTRGGEGSQAAEFKKGTDIESSEIEKGSETDALKRAARKFGIGRYLLNCPKDVKEYGPVLNKWLASLRQSSAPTEAPQAPVNAAPVWWNPVMKDLKAYFKLEGQQWDLFREAAKNALAEGIQVQTRMTEQQASLAIVELWTTILETGKKERA